ncbi:MAG: radical SAM protein, partial [Candidatus Aenigmatarchaeota archaeon]
MITLANPFSWKKQNVPIPLSYLYFYSILEKEGFDVVILNNFNEEDLRKNLASRPNFIGLTSFTGKMLLNVLEIVKISSNYNIPIFIGGPHASALPLQTLKLNGVKGVIVGEGEKTIVDIANNLNSLENVNGIYFKEDGRINRNPLREPIKNLDDLPLPAWDICKDFRRDPLFDNKRTAMIETSRGCPFSCGFCFKSFGDRWRPKSPERVINEIEKLKDMGITAIRILDDNFVMDSERVLKICRKMKKRNLDIEWEIRGGRIDQVNEELLSLMGKSGCQYIGFGIETGSKRMMNFISKNIDISKVPDVFEMCLENEIMPVGFFMTDLVRERTKDLSQTLKLIKNLKNSMCKFTFYQPYPGTDLYQNAKKSGFHEPSSMVGWAKLDMRNTPFY